MRQDGPYGLGVDLGTSNTVAVLRSPDGRTRPLLFDGQPIMPSGVFLDQAGRLHVGRDAQRLAQADPSRYEPNPKRRIDEQTVLLGDREVPTVDLLAAVLGAVARAAVEAVGFLPPAMLTHPAAWGPRRRDVLAQAVARAGWPAVPQTRFTPEPVAAARYFAEVLSRPVPVGSSLAVFDFGGGTLDIAVVRNDGTGPGGRPVFSVVSSGGVDDLGGLDLDAALVEHLGRELTAVPATPPQATGPDAATQRLDLDGIRAASRAADAEAWRRLLQPTSVADRRNRRQFWNDVRGAKEMLSRTAAAPVAVPGVEQAVHLTREELERVVTPLLRRGVHEAAQVIKAAGTTPHELAGLFLVGGSSRVPMVGRLLHADLGIGPTVLEQPELPVAEGALAELMAGAPAAPHPVSPAPAPAQPRPVPASPPGQPPPPRTGFQQPTAYPPPVAAAPPQAYGTVPAPSGGRRSRRGLVVGVVAAAVVLVTLVTVGAVYLTRGRVSPVEFRDLDEGVLIAGLKDTPEASAYYSFAQVVGDRAYVAAQREDKTLEITGIDLTSNRGVWRMVTKEPTYSSWTALWATDRYVVAVGDSTYTETATSPVVVYDRNGEWLWSGRLGRSDTYAMFSDALVVRDGTGLRYRGLDLGNGDERWTFDLPKGEFGAPKADFVRVTSPGNLSGPADGRGFGMDLNRADQRFVLLTSDRRARVFDAATGPTGAEGEVAIDAGLLELSSSGVVAAADGKRLYLGDTKIPYRIDAYDMEKFGAPAVVYNGGDGRDLESMIVCGDGRICITDSTGTAGTEEVAAVDVGDTGGKQVFRHAVPAGIGDENAIVAAAGGGLLAWRKEESGGYRSTLWNADGEERFDEAGVAVRINSRSFLLLAGNPAALSSSPGDVQVAGLLEDSENPEQLGSLRSVKITTCGWNETQVICASGPSGFRIQRFAD